MGELFLRAATRSSRRGVGPLCLLLIGIILYVMHFASCAFRDFEPRMTGFRLGLPS
jgi:hypothetical protein